MTDITSVQKNDFFPRKVCVAQKRALNAIEVGQRFRLCPAHNEVILKASFPSFVLHSLNVHFFLCQRDIAEKIR